MAGVVIAGGGQAGVQAAAALRQAGYEGPVTLVGEEPGLPYQRPPLSKAFLTGDVEPAGLRLRPANFFAAKKIDVLPEERVTGIDRRARRVALRSGGALDYDHLILGTGSRHRRLAVPGADLDGVV
jgi:3-phenylpropionate/trans-cinnamate dioxygenase ferredoxin reductase subunit